MNIVSRRSSNDEDCEPPRSLSFTSQHSDPSGLVISSPTDARRLPDSYVTGNNSPATFATSSSFGESEYSLFLFLFASERADQSSSSRARAAPPATSECGVQSSTIRESPASRARDASHWQRPGRAAERQSNSSNGCAQCAEQHDKGSPASRPRDAAHWQRATRMRSWLLTRQHVKLLIPGRWQYLPWYGKLRVHIA